MALDFGGKANEMKTLKTAFLLTALTLLLLFIGEMFGGARGMTLALIGVLAGLPLALGMGRAVAGLLYGVGPNDFATFAGVAAILAGVAFAACYIPARRAMRTDPTVALKYE